MNQGVLAQGSALSESLFVGVCGQLWQMPQDSEAQTALNPDTRRGFPRSCMTARQVVGRSPRLGHGRTEGSE